MSRTLRTPEHLKMCEMLKAERKKVGLIQKDLAKQLNRPQSFVSKYEIGERELNLLEFLEVAKVIGFDPHEIITKIQHFKS